MTAEVVIANSHAIALAADSAVTIGRSNDPNKKIFNSAIKLFSLSKYTPVAVMFYGNASLAGIPWETLVKVFRSDLKDKKLETIEDYAKEFIGHINKTRYWSNIDCEREIFFRCLEIFSSITELVEERIKSDFEDGNEVNEETTLNAVEEFVNHCWKFAKSKPLLTELNTDFEKKIRRKYLSIFKRAIDRTFVNLPRNRNINRKLYDIGALVNTRYFDENENNVSGIVIAGFGEKEYFPSIVTHEFFGIVDGKLRYKVLKDKSRKLKVGGSTIMPFAQEDMVSAFMLGCDPSIVGDIYTRLDQINESINKDIDEEIDDESKANSLKKKLKSNTENFLKEHFESTQEFVEQNFTNPVVGMVNSLPKDELADMAEALVNLTAFKRRVTNSLETVGGPIDVAVISKGDGLVWVKRKHYFPAELNNHFFANYFRSPNDDDGKEE